MNTIGSRIREFIDKDFGAYKEFAEKLGIHASVLSQYLNDKVMPGSDFLRKIGESGGDLNYIITGVRGTEAVNKKFPVLGKVFAGPSEKLFDPSNIDYYINLPYVKEINCFGVRVEGDSMNGGIVHGDIVLVDMDAEVYPGCRVVCVTAGGERYIKRFKRINDETVMLYSDNSTYEPIILPAADIVVLYKVAGVWHKD